MGFQQVSEPREGLSARLAVQENQCAFLAVGEGIRTTLLPIVSGHL